MIAVTALLQKSGQIIMIRGLYSCTDINDIEHPYSFAEQFNPLLITLSAAIR